MKKLFQALFLLSILLCACGGEQVSGTIHQEQELNPTIEFLDDNGDHKLIFAYTAANCIKDAAPNDQPSLPEQKAAAKQCAWVCEYDALNYDDFDSEIETYTLFMTWIEEMVQTGKLSQDIYVLIENFILEVCGTFKDYSPPLPPASGQSPD